METDAAAREFDHDDHRFTFEVSTDVRDRLVGHGDDHFPLDSAAHRDVWPLDLEPGQLDLIEKRSEITELAKTKAELLRVLTENQTLKISYQNLLDIRKSKTADSISSSKHKIIAKLQQELSEKTLYCNNITEKLVSYKKKYKILKASNSKHPIDSAESTPNPKALAREDHCALLEDRVAQLEQDNRRLSQELEVYKARELLCGQPTQNLTGPASDGLPLDWQRMIEKLKLKTSDVSRDASSVLSKVNDLKELLAELLGATPSTSMLGDDRLMFTLDAEEAVAEEQKAPEDRMLGKRKKSRYEEFAEDPSEQPDESSLFRDILASELKQSGLPTVLALGAGDSKQDLINDPPMRKCLSFGQLEPAQTPPEPLGRSVAPAVHKVEVLPANPKISFGTSDDEESSLTVERAPPALGLRDITHKLQEAAERPKQHSSSKKLIVQKTADRSKPPQQAPRGAGFAEDRVWIDDRAPHTQPPQNPLSQQPGLPRTNHKQIDSDEAGTRTFEALQLQAPVDSPREPLNNSLPQTPALEQSAFKPAKLSMPRFLRPADPAQKPPLSKPLQLQASFNFSLEDIPIKRLPAKSEEPSCLWKRVMLLVEETKKSVAGSKQAYFCLLREFKASFRGSQTPPDYKTHLSALLQESLGAEFYCIKDMLGLTERAVTDADVHQVYVLQSFLYLVFVSHFSETSSSEEEELVDYLLSYRNLDPYLADKFDKIVEIVTNKRHKPHPALASKQPSQQPTTAHHFALLKVVFQHLVQSLERSVFACQTEEVFSSQILANKLNLGELRDSCQYVLGKASAALEGFSFFEGLPDYLLASRRLFGLVKAAELVMHKSYYESLRGVFSNHKYRNTSQQLVVCLLFKQLSVITKD